jgi:hypothetical protein
VVGASLMGAVSTKSAVLGWVWVLLCTHTHPTPVASAQSGVLALCVRVGDLVTFESWIGGLTTSGVVTEYSIPFNIDAGPLTVGGDGAN